MKVIKWIHENVMPNGVVIDNYGNEDGAVGIAPEIKMSADEGGCSIKNCTCSDGHWIMIADGYNEESRTVEGMTVFFDNWGEMQLFLTFKQLKSE